MTPAFLIRTTTEADAKAIRGVLSAAFARENEADLVERLRRENAVALERVAEIGGEIVGYVALTPIKTNPPISGSGLGVGPLAVAPTHQRQGCGAALMEAAIEGAQRLDARLIAVLGEPHYYARFGFEPAKAQRFEFAGFDAGDAFRVIVRGNAGGDDMRAVHYHRAFDKV